MDSKKLTKEQVEEFLEACEKDDEEKLRHLLKKGYRVDEYLECEDYGDCLFTLVTGEFKYSHKDDKPSYLLPKLTKLFYEYGMKEDSWLKEIDNHNVITPYFDLHLAKFNKYFAETIEIMINNNLSQTGFNNMVGWKIDDALFVDDLSKEENVIDFFKYILFMSSFKNYFINCKDLTDFIGCKKDFDYTIFKKVDEMDIKYNIDMPDKSSNKIFDFKVYHNNKLIYSYVFDYKKTYKQMIILIGIPACGKSTFYNKYYKSYAHVNLDTLHTRNKERLFIEESIKNNDSMLIDNTNPTKADRKKYIDIAKVNNYQVIGYYFKLDVKGSLERNKNRDRVVKEAAIKHIYNILELPSLDEGFDKLHYVYIKDNDFVIEDWTEE